MPSVYTLLRVARNGALLLALSACYSPYSRPQRPLIDYDEAEIFGRQDCHEMTATSEAIGSQRTCFARDGRRRRG